MFNLLRGLGLPRRRSFVLALLGLLSILFPYYLQAAPSANYSLYLPGIFRTHEPSTFGPDYELGYGISTATNQNDKVVDLGFGYIKLYMQWADFESSRGTYLWVQNPGAEGVKPWVQDAVSKGLRVIIRMDTSPAWATASGVRGSSPPADMADFGNFMGAYAAYMKDLVAAYEIWQEPNVGYQWGNSAPNPELYKQMLQAAYPKIKASDPKATVIAAGLVSTAGDGGATALNDLDFIQRMYTAGAKPYFDAMGSHPYGYGDPPETRNANAITDFQRAADQYAVMVQNDDGDKKVWATDFGWLLDPTFYGHPEYLNHAAWSNRAWQAVSPTTQADYLVRAYRYAYNNWPWMAVMVTFNMDMSTVPWYEPQQVERWYSILNDDSTPRTAYNSLKAMSKPIRK